MARGRDMAHARARVLPSVSFAVSRGLMELRSLLRDPSETDSERDAPEHGLRRDAAATEDESVIGSIVSGQREELEREIGELKEEAERIAGNGLGRDAR